MEELRFKVAEFSALVGASQKTIYSLIDKGELITVNEVQKGRKISLIITNNEQIEQLKENYGKFTVNESNYEDILTVNESNYTSISPEPQQNQVNVNDILDRFQDLSLTYNEQLMKVNEELITYKSKVPLLEDKANREGLYLTEINQLRNNGKKLFTIFIVNLIISVIAISVLVVLIILEHNKPPKIEKVEVTKVVEKPVIKKK